MDLAERLERWTRRTDTCWHWTGQVDRGGYGKLWVAGKQWKAHRAAYQAHVAPLPPVRRGEKCCVLHRCDNPKCVNPAHLFLGTHAENMRDKQAKGRAIGARPRELHHGAKLTADRVSQIRAEPHRAKEWAELFGVNRRTIAGVIKNETWTN